MENSTPPLKILETSHLHKSEAGWVVPLIQSSITGALVTIPLIIVMARIGLHIVDVLTWSAIVFFAVTFGMWIYIWWAWFCLTMERFTGVDINGDGVIGEKTGPEIIRSIRVDMQSTPNGYPQTVIARFPSERKLIAVADAVINADAAFSFGEIVTNRGLCSQGEFKVIVEEMLARQIVAYKNPEYPKLGVELTEAGRVVLTELLDRPEGF